MAAGERDLTKGPITRTLIGFALPTLGSSIVQSLNGSINAVWIGRLLGETALSAASNANLVLFLMLSALFGLGMATLILVGQAMGRRDIDRVRRVTGTAISGFLIVSLAIAAIGYAATADILRLIGTPPDARGMASDYLRMIFLALPLLSFMTLLTMAQRGAGDSRTPFLFMTMTAVIDVVLNPVFILGLGPMPAMGIAGSAFATLTANFISALSLVIYIYAQDMPIRLRGAEWRYLRPDRTLVTAIVAKGVPMGMQVVLVSLSSLLMISFVNGYGVETAAAYGVTVQLWAYVQMPSLAISAAVSSMAAQNIGAGLWHRVGQATRAGLIVNLLLSGGLVLLITLVDRPALALFLGEGSSTIPIARHIHLIASWSFILLGIALVYFGTMRANGAVMGPLVIILLALLIVRPGFALLLRERLGADAIWWSFPAGALATAVMASLYYRYGGWRKVSEPLDVGPIAG